MGKYERKDIELMEKSVVNLLCGKNPLIKPGTKWFRHMLAFVNYIKKSYSHSRHVRHVGNRYGVLRGDIEITTQKNKRIFIELKASESRSGKGTLANISQNSLTLYGLIGKKDGKKPLSWSKFRRKVSFKRRAEDLLNSYSYPETLGFYEKARYMREKAKIGDKKALRIKKLIMILAKQDKKNYLNYIRHFPVKEANLKKFVFCMLNGIHTQKEILSFLERKKLDSLKTRAPIITLYANLKDDKVVVSREENMNEDILKNSVNLKFDFPEKLANKVYAYVVVYDKKKRKSRKLLGLIYHWKNIFQGIKTPCINVFLA